MGKYVVTNNQNETLRTARHIARDVWNTNFEKAYKENSLLQKLPGSIKKSLFFSEGNAMRSYNLTAQNICSERGYDNLHNHILETLVNQKDIELNDSNAYYCQFFDGLYNALKEKGISLESLSGCIKEMGSEPLLNMSQNPI